MKTTTWLALLAAAGFTSLLGSLEVTSAQSPAGPAPVVGPGPGTSSLSQGAVEVVRMQASGMSDDVLLAYVQGAQAPFNLSADNVLYLQKLGFSSAVITAMLDQDRVLGGQPAPAPVMAAAAPVVAPAPPAAPPAVYVSNPPQAVSYFYGGLAPYGAWVQVEGVGWCWQPREVVLNQALAALLRRRPLGLDRRGLVLAVGLSVGLGGVSLRAVAPARAVRLGLGAR